MLPTSIDTRTMPTSLKLASDSGCQLTDSEKIAVAQHLRETKGPAHIQILDASLLVQVVGYIISSYRPGGYDIPFIASAEPLTPYLIVVRVKFSPPASPLRVPLISLLKLATFRMAAQERWSLA